MPLVSNVLVYLALLQVVEASPKKISALDEASEKSTEVKLLGLDKTLCDHIEPPVLPTINAVFVFTTPLTACWPSQTSLVKLIESSRKTLLYSCNNTRCSLHKKEGLIGETNSTNTSPSYNAILLVINMIPKEWNKPRKKNILDQKVSTICS